MKYQDDNVRYELIIDNNKLKVAFFGKSTMPGTDAFIDAIEKEVQRQGTSVLRILMDLRGLTNIPLRVQIRMSKWLLRIKNDIEMVIVLGGGRVAKALAKGARMSNVSFFDLEEPALAHFKG